MIRFVQLCALVICVLAVTENPLSYNQQDCLKGFMEVVPTEKIHEITMDHLHRDPEFVAVLRQLQGEKFDQIIGTMREAQPWIDLKKYLQDLGFDMNLLVERMMHCTHHNITNLATDPSIKPNMTAFANEVMETLPKYDLLAFFAGKMHNMDFQRCFRQLSGNETKVLFDHVLDLQGMKNMLSTLGDMGFEGKKFFESLYSLFGWKFSW